MKNLKVIKNITKDISAFSSNVFEFEVDNINQIIYLLFVDGTASKLSLTQNNAELDNFHIANSPVRLTLLSVTNEICIADSHSITIFDKDLNINCVKEVEDGCSAVEFNPGQDVFVALTLTGLVQLYMLTTFGEFSLIAQINLNDHKFTSQFINVGWGSKETQFHGSEGKDARKKVGPGIDESIGINCEKSIITWRGDGALFAVSFLRGDSFAFLVADKDGVPLNANEICPGLEHPLVWRPSGNLITGVQRLGDNYQVVFFEKNGLRHGEFTINSSVPVEKLSWSVDSEVLAISYKNKIELWTMGNYYWYLKQSLLFDESLPLHTFEWDKSIDVRGRKVMYVLCGDKYVTYEWIWEINHSKGYTEQDLACVAVIDGQKVLLTPFKNVTIPPPMCALSLTHESPVNFVIFNSQNENSNNFCVILNDFTCIFYEHKNTIEFIYEIKAKIKLDQFKTSKIPLVLNNFINLKNNSLICCSNNNLYKYNVEENIVNSNNLNDSISNIELWPENNDLIIQFSNGNFHKFNSQTQTLSERIFTISTQCDKIKAFQSGNVMIVITLDRFNRFYVNDDCIANNITSFFLHSKFLLLTTSQHKLICIKTDDDFDILKTGNNLFTRQVERGSKLIVAVPQDKKVILQMPRGNLETIYPRVISIDILATLIDSKKYREAFEIMKTERINLNLLHDHNPKQFVENISLIIEQINDPILLNMFLLELQDSNVCITMYKTCYSKNMVEIPQKKILITEEMIKQIRTRDDWKKFALTLITAYVVRKTQVDLENALQIIQSIEAEAKNGESIPVSVDKMLNHLIILVNINELYDTALGMYNFDLIMLVASKSQKDPKEYIPFLNQLQKMEENYKHFVIDNHLKRYEKALISISKCTDKFDECLQFTKTHKLYKNAIPLFQNNEEHLVKICKAFGDFLAEKRCYNEAGLMYERSKNLHEALSMYKTSLNWKHCIVVATKLCFNQIELHDLYRALVEELIAQRRFNDAATLLMNNLNDYEEAIGVLCQGKCWADVLSLAHLKNRLDLIETHLKPSIINQSEVLITLLLTSKENFDQQRQRLKVLQSNKKPLYNDISGKGDRDNELYSDAGSVCSQFTSTSKSSTSSFKSFRSSKNRRKHERKLISMKEGSAFEDIAIIRSLHQLITNTAGLREEVNRLCSMLVYFELNEEAKNIQTTLEQLLKEMKEAENEIWSLEVMQFKSVQFGPNMTANDASEALKNDALTQDRYSNLEPHFRFPPQIPTIQWKLYILD